ncbi:hypothetical protein BKA61DRAFT_213804 [Leptodontidium sp. MPI-SDFR-AT-0119]|nr:hypothetical protein BKA61DRAFT_213804 [Leptodontidium sp. MPI-SDFR-AT-0119]
MPSLTRATTSRHAACFAEPLISNALFIQRVVVSEQKSTRDTCETVNENSLFESCSKEDLLLLGGIYTHPTQSCFMSSVDLHTQFGISDQDEGEHCDCLYAE